MTDNKRTIKQMVEAGLGPDVIADGIDLSDVLLKKGGRWGRR